MNAKAKLPDPWGKLSRRRFVAVSLAGLPGFISAAEEAVSAKGPSPEILIQDPGGALARTQAPCRVSLALTTGLRRAATERRLYLREQASRDSRSNVRVPVQCLAQDGGGNATLCWLMPSEATEHRALVLEEGTRPTQSTVQVFRQETGSRFEIAEEGKPVLRYNYAKVEPGDLLDKVSDSNRKYAVARSDYIHPLYGPHGEVLTRDWPLEHPHHRGIYWAWPEVDWHGERGDLHALQKVFARPTGKCEAVSGPVFAQLNAENLWHWEDREPIVREGAIIRAYCATSLGRLLDLEFHFEALGDPVQLARRGTSHYGGLNLRLSAIKNQQLTKHSDPTEAKPRRAWSDLAGTFAGSEAPAGLVVMQHASNPDYPGDWIEYPELNWLQPAFPASGTRYELRKGEPLVLRFRLWIHFGSPVSEALASDHWQAAHSRFSLLT